LKRTIVNADCIVTNRLALSIIPSVTCIVEMLCKIRTIP
jgi:hypothetical protein